jgi:predicted RNase H-like HicB family nuclease
MKVYTVEFEQEDDGRWIADVIDIPGVTVYGATPEEAMKHAQALALRVLADQVEDGEQSGPLELSFVSAA